MIWSTLAAHFGRVSEAQRESALVELRKRFLSFAITPSYLDDDATCAAYEEWFFPQSFAKAASVLGELPECEVKTVVDLGSAMGPLAFAAWQRWPQARFVLVDQSQGALRSGRALAEKLRARVETRVLSLDKWSEPTDLILAGNALLELPNPAEAARALLAQLHAARSSRDPRARRPHPDARSLQALRDSPLPDRADRAVPAHAQACPASIRPRDFCHQARSLALPEWWHARARALGVSDDRMRFSYLTYAASPEPQPQGLVRIISHRIKEKGRTRYFACSGAGALELLRQDRLALAQGYQRRLRRPPAAAPCSRSPRRTAPSKSAPKTRSRSLIGPPDPVGRREVSEDSL